MAVPADYLSVYNSLSTKFGASTLRRGDGYPLREIERAERQVRLVLPDAVRVFYNKAARAELLA